MATGRFRSPKTEAEEIALLSETVPKNMKHNTKWVVNVFTTWQNTRMNKKVQLQTVGGNGLERTNVEDLSAPLQHTSAKSLNFWLWNSTLLRRSTYLFAALTAIWQMYRGKWLSTYWTKVTGGKMKFFEVIFFIFCVLISRDLYQKLMNTN